MNLHSQQNLIRNTLAVIYREKDKGVETVEIWHMIFEHMRRLRVGPCINKRALDNQVSFRFPFISTWIFNTLELVSCHTLILFNQQSYINFKKINNVQNLSLIPRVLYFMFFKKNSIIWFISQYSSLYIVTISKATWWIELEGVKLQHLKNF